MAHAMKPITSNRIQRVKRSFIREILKDMEHEEIISFSGGFPSPLTFPIPQLAELSNAIFARDGARILQYSSTEGYAPLRAWIAARYAQQHNMSIDPDTILITNGSQQAFDLIAKVFLHPGDGVLVEEPTYLGALQSFSLFEPNFYSAALTPQGIDLVAVDAILAQRSIKLMYSVPTFQNPSGRSYDLATRQALAKRLIHANILLVEDDPYSDLRYEGTALPPITRFMPETSILLGSFSKIISPGLRIGWMVIPQGWVDAFIVAKEAADLQASLYAQMLIHDFVSRYDLDAHLAHTRTRYQTQRDQMVTAMRSKLPPEVRFEVPEGGMFIWVELPAPLTAMQVYAETKKRKLVFVPGDPFYVDDRSATTLRLNFTNSTPSDIEEGINRLAEAIGVCLAV
jgi:2-aminoadipate transaminase